MQAAPPNKASEIGSPIDSSPNISNHCVEGKDTPQFLLKTVRSVEIILGLRVKLVFFNQCYVEL